MDQVVRGPIKAHDQSWQDLYRAAIYEPDADRTAERIAEAEHEIVARTRWLFHSSEDAVAERNALNGALYALGLLKSYSRHNDLREPGSKREVAT